MKKLLLTAVFAVITIVSINAQEFGAKAGVNFATLNGDEDFDGRTSFFVGGVVAIQTALNVDSPFIPKYLIGFATKRSVILEFAPTFMSVILAGKVGSYIC